MERPDLREFRRIITSQRSLTPNEYLYVARYMEDMSYFWRYCHLYTKPFGEYYRSARKEFDSIRWARVYRKRAREGLIRLFFQVKNLELDYGTIQEKRCA